MRVRTGVDGFDPIVGGGLPEGAAVILQGPGGNEKGMFGLQFLAEGLRSGEAVLIVLSSTSPDEYLESLSKLGANVREAIAGNRLKVVDWHAYQQEAVAGVEERDHVLRCSIDLTNVGIALSRALAGLAPGVARRAVLEILSPALQAFEVGQVYAFAQSSKAKLARAKVTALFLLEKEMHSPATVSSAAQPFDGVIDIDRSREGDTITRKIGVLSMKDTVPDEKFHDFLMVAGRGMFIKPLGPGGASPRPSAEPTSAGPPPEAPSLEPSVPSDRAQMILRIAEERLRVDPKDADALFAKASALAAMGDLRGATGALDALVRVADTYPGLWVLRAKLFALLGDSEAARESRRKAEEIQRREEQKARVGETVPCPLCAGAVPVDAHVCPTCGAEFVEEIGLAEELDSLGKIAIQDKVREDLKVEPETGVPIDRRPTPKPHEERIVEPKVPPPKEPAGRRGMTNGLVRQSLRGQAGRTNGLTNGLKGRTNGLTNGLKGRTNGLTNGNRGRTNGLTNGLRGKTNGVTNGVTNGLTNGLAALRRGMTNGLTNGSGFTNGLGVGRFMREITMAKWKLYVIPAVCGVLLLVPLMSPSYVSPSSYPIQIDGNPADWDPAAIGTQASVSGLNPNIDILRFGVSDNVDYLAFYVEVSGSALRGGDSPPTMDSFRIFLDTDRSPSTGFRVGGLGADRMLEVSGWRGAVNVSSLFEWDTNANGNDWRGWIKGTGATAAVAGGRIEAEVEWLALLPDKEPVYAVAHARGFDGSEDSSDYAANSEGGSLLVLQDYPVPDIVTGGNTQLLKLEMSAIRAPVNVSGITVTLTGSARYDAASRLTLVDGLGAQVDQRVPVDRRVSFQFAGRTIAAGSVERMFVVAETVGSTGETLGAVLAGPTDLVAPGAAVTIRQLPSARTVGYLGSIPAGPRIDGGFAEWPSAIPDPVGDVSGGARTDIDLTGFDARFTANGSYFLVQVGGRLMSGVWVPESNALAPAGGSSPSDQDRDGVPDGIDPLPFDFNNDGTPDSQTGSDYDGDNITDYGLPGGTDLWLNTTIPASFPAPYAGRAVTVYIGPVQRPFRSRDDILRVFVDFDNLSWTGYAIGGLGADRLVEVSGSSGLVRAGGLLAFSGSFPGEWSWSFLSNISFALGYGQGEFASSVNLSSGNSRIFAEIGDAFGSRDGADPITRGTRGGGLLPQGLTSAADTSFASAPNPIAPDAWRRSDLGTRSVTLIDGNSNAVSTTYNHQRKLVRAGDVPGDTACDSATNSDGCWYTVFSDQLAEATTNTAPSTETITKGSKVSGTFPADVQTSNNVSIRYREANQAPVVDHTFVEQTTQQTTTSTSYVNITGASIASGSFTSGRKYLLVFTAQVDSSSGTRNAYIQTIHGTTAFPGSEFSFQTIDVAARYDYYWFTVWTAVSGEGVVLQFKSESSAATIAADQITMFKLDLGDLTQSTDWFFNENTAGDTITGTTWQGLASVTFTPSAASDWLVMTTMRGDPDSVSKEYQSRIARSGGGVETQPLTQWEGNDVNNDRFVQTLARVYSLTAASNTFTQESACSATCTYPRSYSAVFALNLNRFEDRTSVWTEAPIALSTTDFATQIQTASLTPTRVADVWIVGQFAVDVDTNSIAHKFRLQVDNVDQPGTQTSDAYKKWSAWDITDEVLAPIQTVESLSVAAHTFDLDASQSGTTANAEDRVIFAVSLVLLSYQMEVRHDWSGIASGNPAYVLKVEANHTAGEDFLAQVLTPPSTWNTRITVTKTADDDTVQTYTLTTAEFNSGAPAVRFVGSVETLDQAQSDLYLDYVTVSSMSHWDRIILMRSSDTGGSTWGSQVVLASGRTGDGALVLARDSSEPSIAIDSGGFLQVVWVATSVAGDQSTLNLVRYTKTTVAYPTQSELANAANWETVTNVDDADTGYMPTVSTDTSNNPHIAWSGSKTSGTVYYKNKAGGTWRSTVSWGSTYTGLSVDVSPQNNYVSLARYYEAATNEIQYVVCKDLSTSNCTAAAEFTRFNGAAGYDTVATAVEGGSYPSLATTYESNGDLWVAYAKDVATENVQNGAAQIAAGSSSTTASITAVDTAKAFLVFNIRHNQAAPSDGTVSGQISASTTLTFARTGTVGTVDIEWYVAEFSSGVSVQRGSVVLDGIGNDQNVAISTVDLTKAFPIVSYREVGATYNCDDFIRATITSSTNLQLSACAPDSAVEWQVIQYTDSSVQTGAVSFGTADASKTASLASSVDVGKSWLMFTYKTDSGVDANIGQKMVRGQLTDSITLTFDRDSTGQALDLRWYLVKFTDDTTTQRGSAGFGTADTQKDVAITPGLPLSGAIAFTGTSNPSGGGKTPFSTDDNPGPALATLDFTSTVNLRLTRATTQSSTADIGWFAIEFPRTRAVYARFLDYPTNGWQTADTVDSLSDTVLTRPSIGIDKNDNAHALYVATTGPQLYYNSRIGGTWGTRGPVGTSSDNPTIIVRAPNDATYGTMTAGLYWKTSTSETYFFIPEFESVLIPVIAALFVLVCRARWADRRRGRHPQSLDFRGGRGGGRCPEDQVALDDGYPASRDKGLLPRG